ncbi:MAG: AAA family ATPase [Deltaproteobacteria bacterium]|nr:AAA family ATPase [Deltaproteobacteria bacterium]
MQFSEFSFRPRRFGKTLLTDTLDCLFKGQRELFKGVCGLTVLLIICSLIL